MANPEHEDVVQQGAKAIAEWRMKYGRITLDLSGADLRGVDLNGVKMPKANLGGANLNRANLSCTDLSDANLVGANLSEADLMCACCSGAELCDADLREANLNQTDLSWADLTNANFSGAIVKKVNFSNAQGGDLSNAKEFVPSHQDEVAAAREKSKGKMSKGVKLILFFLLILLVTLIPGMLMSPPGGKPLTTAQFLAGLIPFIAFLLFYFSIIVGTAMIATEKGYSITIGLILVLTLSVVGLLIMLLLPENQSQEYF
ncbi:pentapeptide repeat-containing protein [Gimesia panareensis]|uniref:pentapeptide repeat-containing protein n=1 Tax=Gimesia panareensis TaxID=2527978 RepID=UPI00118BC07A|nr:pentapeptide repeat-containing protein [Gimesia panareensis]QDU48718.1 Secreted effector protein pipB2 [Gimesia panareensis]